MKIYKGDVNINKDNAAEWGEKLKDCEKITGAVWADNAKISLPVCSEVGGDVRAYNASEISLPVCGEVGGDVSAYNAKVSLPVCREVGGAVRADNAKISLPEKYGNNPKPIKDVFEKKGYMLADGILTRIISKRKSG